LCKLYERPPKSARFSYFHHMTTTEKLKHPAGLPYLFFSEMWERFGYYLIIGIFTQYLEASDKEGGFGMSTSESADIYGTFIALVFLTPFVGGLLADRIMGYRKSIVVGGLLMGAGYCLLAVNGMFAFWTALVLIIIGNGFFKPNISTLLGNLYNEKKYSSLKDSGYSIFYMGINIGACICNFFAASLRNHYGWGAAFMCAGIGMFLGVAIFLAGNRHYKHADVLKPLQAGDMTMMQIMGTTIMPAILAGILGWMIPGNIFGSDSTDAFLIGALPVVGFYVATYARSNANEKKPVGAMLAIFAVVVIFWAVFKQNGTALTTWANKYTDREMPAAVAKPLDWLGFAKKISSKPDTITLTDAHFRKQYEKGAAGKVVMSYPKGKDGKPDLTQEQKPKEKKVVAQNDYFKNLPPEKMPPPGQPVVTLNTEIFQSVNPSWVVILTFPIVALFAWLARRRKEPSTASKIALGLFISGLSTLVMVAAVYAGSNGAVKVSPWWLIGAYGVVTVGELCLSPMGLSLVSKLSPARITALMMGGWFLATSLGNKLSGVLASMWDSYDNKAYFFLVNFGLLIFATLIMLFMLKRLNAILKQYS
jgi:proton-dependent oligopeptide transporter, POT family